MIYLYQRPDAINAENWESDRGPRASRYTFLPTQPWPTRINNILHKSLYFGFSFWRRILKYLPS